MATIPRPPDLRLRFADLERRLRDLETGGHSAEPVDVVTLRAASAPDQLELDDAPNVWRPDPDLTVTVDVADGQLLVTVSANLTLNGAGDLEMGVALAGPTPADYDRGHALATYGEPVQGSYQFVFGSLTTGTYTVTAGYYLAATSGTAAFRTLAAQPL